MGEKLTRILEILKKSLSVFQNQKFQKNSRITYGVFWNLLLIFIIVIVIGVSFAGGVGAGYFASLVKDEPLRSYAQMKKDIYNYEETSKLYFGGDVYLGKLRTDLEREEVSLKNVSKYVQEALIATEDQYFYEHKGVVPKALLRAVLQEVTNSSTQTGGSTLTQQIIKNQILTNEVSFDRKAKEVLLALRLEKFFEKDEILEAYLNVSTFGRNSSGHNIAGIQTAAKGIFGVDAKDLNIPQSAFIAGLPQSPFGYTPFTNEGKLKTKEGMEPGLNRMKIVLHRMYDNGYLSKKEYDDALKYDIVKDFIKPQKSPLEKYPWLAYEIEDRTRKIMANILAKKDGYSEKDLEKKDELSEKYLTLADRDIRQNGYSIHTTINKKIYDNMQKAKNDFKGYGPDKTVTKVNKKTGEEESVVEPVQIGGILIENSTGKILSFVGGRDFKTEQLNHATQGKRANGSTMKPLLVYGPSLEYGTLSPGSPIADTSFSIKAGGATWSPTNYSTNREYGIVSARKALAYSYNLSAAKTYLKIMDKRPADYLRKMGITTLLDKDYYVPSLALGGITNGVTVEENVNAYTTFANGGKFIDAYLIDKITDHDGKVIYQHKSKPVKVFSPQTSYLLIDMMRDVLRYGTAGSVPSMLKFSSDWTGKTGTSNDYKDSWIVASNPNVTFGTWIGYDTPSSLYDSRYADYNIRNYRIWAKLMNTAYDADRKLIDPDKRFKMPGGIVQRSYCTVSGKLPSEGCSNAGLIASDLFNAKFVPKEKDDSFVQGKYVTINNIKYLALDSTPAEFSQNGLILNPDFIKEITGGAKTDPRKLIPNSSLWDKVFVADAKMADDGKNPAPVKVNASGNSVIWKPSPSPDVIGYRIYTSTGKILGSIKAGSNYGFAPGNGEFYVVAVDIAGKESQHSNTIKIGKTVTEKEDKPDKDQETNGAGNDKKPGDQPGENNDDPSGEGEISDTQ